MKYTRIIGTGSYLPEKVLTNKELEKMVDTTEEWIMDRTGISERRISGPGDSTTSMAYAAAKAAIEMADIDPHTIDMIVVGTTTPDKMFPGTAIHVQELLGIKGCPAFDLSAACAGFNYSLGIADNFIKTGAAKRVLVIGSETMSRMVDWTERSTCILFGDGAGAVVVEASDEPGILSTQLHADGSYKDLPWAPNPGLDEKGDFIYPYLKMAGAEVFKLAVTCLGQAVLESLEASGREKKDIDWLIPHQANMRIISAIAKRLHLPMEKVIITVGKHGNTSAASIPLALDEAVRDGRVKRGDVVLLESFGAGFTWGASLVVF